MTTLPRNAAVGSGLRGRLLAISVSAPDDLGLLGFPSDQMDRVLQAVLTPLVSDGARIAYGGRIRHDHNFTLVISNHLGEAYRRLEQSPGERPFVHFLARHRFVAEDPQAIVEHVKILAPYGELWLPGPSVVEGVVACIDTRAPAFAIEPHPETSPAGGAEYFDGGAKLRQTSIYRSIMNTPPPTENDGFTEMREAMARLCDARVIVGGRTTGFSGEMSGVTEEALLTIKAGRPLIVLGGFGGASRDIAIALGLLDPSEQTPFDPAPDRGRYESGLDQLRGVRQTFESSITGQLLPLLRELAATDSLADATAGLVRFFRRTLPPKT